MLRLRNECRLELGFALGWSILDRLFPLCGRAMRQLDKIGHVIPAMENKRELLFYSWKIGVHEIPIALQASLLLRDMELL